MLVGFHGYGEDAEAQLERLRSIPGSERWLIVSIQGLHRFYARSMDRVVASWMTRQDRELAIEDNIEYVNACLDAVEGEWAVTSKVVFAGFSQGVAMAYRAAATSTRGTAGVIAAGGDVPPEVSLDRIPVLILRGITDEWYTKGKLDDDLRRLLAASIDVSAPEFQAGHEWSSEMSAAAGEFLAACLTIL